jgi:hypothetical protein
MTWLAWQHCRAAGIALAPLAPGRLKASLMIGEER